MVAISILIRTIGKQPALKEALDSLKVQTFKDFEVVIVEDGPATLNAFFFGYRDLPIRYEALSTNKGRSTAGNRALSLSQGEYCLFLDEDDALAPDHLRLLLEAVRAENRRIAYSWSEEHPVERDKEGNITKRGRFKRRRRERFSLLHLIAGNYLPINAVLFHRSLYERAGGFDQDMDCLEDWLLWLRFAAIEPEWLCVPNPTAIYHVPMEIGSRRRAFRQWHAKARERMQSIVGAWPAELLYRDLKAHFGIAIFLRKLYYQLTGYL